MLADQIGNDYGDYLRGVAAEFRERGTQRF
jgi:hypothetical protein